MNFLHLVRITAAARRKVILRGRGTNYYSRRPHALHDNLSERDIMCNIKRDNIMLGDGNIIISFSRDRRRNDAQKL